MLLDSKLYLKSPHISSTKTQLPDNPRAATFEEVGVILPSDAAGEVRMACPQCSHNRRKSRDPCLSVNVTDGVWFCHHCGWKGGLRRHGYYPRRSARRALPGSAAPQPTRSSPDAEAEADAERHRQRLKAVWRQGRGITADDPAGLYLMRRAVWQTPLPAVLRYHPALPYHYNRAEHCRPTTYPALIAAIQGPDGRVVSLHRIYLNHDGHKADVPTPKKFMQPTTTVVGAAIRLDPAADELVVTEGVETALAVRLMTGMATWSSLSTSGMANLWVPQTARLVVIAADHDVHGKGQEAAHKLRDRLLKEKHRVKILIPETPGSDWADTLTEGACHA